jgi:hypothetical protein
MDAAKKYCCTYVQQFMRGEKPLPYESHGPTPDRDELKYYLQKFIRENNYNLNLDFVKCSYVNLEERYNDDAKLAGLGCCCIVWWSKYKYNKEKANPPWTIQIGLRKSNVIPMPMLGRNSVRLEGGGSPL